MSHFTNSGCRAKILGVNTRIKEARLAAGLTLHHDRMVTRAEKVGVKMVGDPWVFTDDPKCAKPWNPDIVSHRWRRFTTAQGHPGIRLHDLRHAMATAWLDAGIPVHVVSQRLGHAKVSTTTDIYGHTPDGAQAAAAARMADRLPTLELGP